MKVVLGSDHGGYELKMSLKRHLEAKGIETTDIGAEDGTTSVSYVHFGLEAARKVASGEADFGIVVCGTGLGISIAANKVKGIRCALCTNEFMAEMSRRHNNANMLALGGRVLAPAYASRLADIFLETEFDGGRHAVRVGQIEAFEGVKA